jgi:O-antigen/teichoic acid export membrane protein
MLRVTGHLFRSLQRLLSGEEGRGSFVRNSMRVFVLKALGIVLITGLTMVLTRRMGAFEYGRLAYITSATYILVILCTAGLPTAAMRFVSRYLVRGQAGNVSAYLVFSIVFIVLAALVAGAPLRYALTYLWPSSDYSFSLLSIVEMVAALGLMRFMTDAMRGLGQPVAGAAFENVWSRLIVIVFVVAFLAWGGALDAQTAVYLTASSNLLLAVMLIVYVFRRFRLPVITSIFRARFLFRRGRIWLSVSGFMMLTPVLYYVLSETDLLMLGALRTPSDVALYQVARRLAELTSFCSVAVNTLGMSLLSSSHTQRRQDELQRTVDLINVLSLLPALAVLAGLVLLGGPLARLFGEGFDACYGVMIALSAARVVETAFGPASEVLLMTGHHVRASAMNVFFALLNVVLAVILIPMFGIAGAASATIGATLLWKANQYRIVRSYGFVESSLLVRAVERAWALVSGARLSGTSP